MSQKIVIDVDLDEKKIPSDIRWKADGQGESEAKAILMSIFERESKDTMKMDLWTDDMQMMEMDRFFYYSLLSMADTYHRATKNDELASDMKNFASYFGEKTGILKKNS